MFQSSGAKDRGLAGGLSQYRRIQIWSWVVSKQIFYLVPCAIIIIAWASSYLSQYTLPVGLATGQVCILSIQGAIHIQGVSSSVPGLVAINLPRGYTSPPASGRNESSREHLFGLYAVHVGTMWVRTRTINYWELKIRYGGLFMFTLPGVVLWLRNLFRFLERSRLENIGHCPQCGYDLRASKERCPECGEPISRRIS